MTFCLCHHGDGPSKIANLVLNAILLIFGGSIEIWYELSISSFSFLFSYIFKVYSALEINNWQPKRVEGFLYSLHHTVLILLHYSAAFRLLWIVGGSIV